MIAERILAPARIAEAGMTKLGTGEWRREG
jgi:hypothetical protein